jgi:hypothetical protein
MVLVSDALLLLSALEFSQIPCLICISVLPVTVEDIYEATSSQLKLYHH